MPCLLNSVDCYKKGHYMVVYGKVDHVLSAVHRDRLVIFGILENVDVFSSDTLQKLSLDFAVSEPCELSVDFEYRRAVFIR